MIRIRSKRDGFWRCGVQHSKNWTEYPDDRFTPAELERLKAEPVLVVEEVRPVKESPKAKVESPKVVKGKKREEPEEWIPPLEDVIDPTV